MIGLVRGLEKGEMAVGVAAMVADVHEVALLLCRDDWNTLPSTLLFRVIFEICRNAKIALLRLKMKRQIDRILKVEATR